LLPKYRGPNVWFWLYHEMEREGGATIHFIDEKEDSGDILKQASFPIRLGMPPQELRQRTIELGSELLSATLTEIENGTAHPALQRHLQCPQRGRHLKPGEQLFPWSEWDIERVYHFLAGVYPWYRAFQGKHGVPGNLPWKAVGYEKCAIAAPGSVRLDRGGAYFAHPQGKVCLQLAVSGAHIAFWLIMATMLIFAWLLRHVI
jgi:methionyl-tRNA formyltransferase